MTRLARALKPGGLLVIESFAGSTPGWPGRHHGSSSATTSMTQMSPILLPHVK
jgi:hypothetical protein